MVCYGEYSNHQNIAEHAGLSQEEVLQIHLLRDYLIYMLGFLPGFTYLGGLDERLELRPSLAKCKNQDSRQEAWESEVPRQEFILWIRREMAAYGNDPVNCSE